MREKRHDIVINLAVIVLIGLTFLAFVKAIWISLDIDESYAVACAYRMVRGDKLVRDMWEPHQLSAFLAALLAAPYIWIRGNTDYLVIYLRLVGILIHTGMGVLLYRQMKRNVDPRFAVCILLLHLNYLPKWVQMPEFELMHYWCLLGIFLVLHMYFTGEKHKLFLPFIGGCLLTGSIMCYPTMILLWPFYLLALRLLERQYCQRTGIAAWRSGFLFTLGAFVSGAAFLAYLFSYLSLDEIMRYVSYIFLDTSHNVYSMGEKWAIYMGQMWEQALWCGGCLLLATGIVLAVSRKIFKDRLLTAVAIAVTAGVLMQVRAIYGFLLGDENQFFFQIRYMAVLLPAVILCVCHYRRMALWLHLCIIPSLVSLTAVLLVTNMDTNTAYTKVFLGVLASLLVLYQYARESVEDDFWKGFMRALCYAVGGLILAGLLICRLILIRVSGCLPVTILAPLVRMENGPEKGVYVLADTAQIWNDNYRELEELVSGEDRVLYIGAESLVYVKMEAVPATPSTHSTVVYNEMFLRYYEEHPERIPNVVVYDKSFAENPVYALYYGYSLQYPEFLDWLEENYCDGQKTETAHMIVVRKEETGFPD
ncbi:MAG: hypothetical protein NC543_08690 [bacterium]|nr:hypothetical protein [bacterium]MCM1375522.1 hypothetical protein [Muribaculum sp.]